MKMLQHKLASHSGALGLHGRHALRTKNSLSEVFHENTKLGRWSARAAAIWTFTYTRSRAYKETIQHEYKTYTLMERLPLPEVAPRSDLERTIAARRSTRTFSGAPLALDELARLLRFSYGRTDERGQFRAVASGGALYPLELYVLAFKVDGLDPGVYHYGVETAHLDLVTPGDCLPTAKDAIYWQGVDIDRAAAAIVITAIFYRSTIKYLDRGYRMVLMEAGEAAQNLGLMASSLQLGACLVGGFHDDRLSALLDIDGVEEAPLLPIILGRPGFE